MKPIEFEDQNKIFAKDQPEYIPLPALVIDDTVISCWGLTFKERLTILFTGCVWLQILTFKQPLQPQLVTVTKPFINPAKAEQKKERRMFLWGI